MGGRERGRETQTHTYVQRFTKIVKAKKSERECVVRGREKRERGRYALIEFSVTSTIHGRLISSIHFCNVIALDLLDAVLSNIACKWDLKGTNLLL